MMMDLRASVATPLCPKQPEATRSDPKRPEATRSDPKRAGCMHSTVLPDRSVLGTPGPMQNIAWRAQEKPPHRGRDVSSLVNHAVGFSARGVPSPGHGSPALPCPALPRPGYRKRAPHCLPNGPDTGRRPPEMVGRALALLAKKVLIERAP
ncbi:uncharacterized protein UV8b_07785 [Ustilaginoidea virens]|uniref:Uncharacterized protein n=1 Tax=Ustilaginoidea virens TaxID=1159556 RepID=A0A8E5HXR5_USTVR|nr:uncharacterized protein UV8b_07785 [Ustilaginoidea virens]QUC23544.1 hypothetical protein UV8b_07785 [Ustilaginoidea virens]